MVMTTFRAAWAVLQHHTGVVIPVYLPHGPDREPSIALLRDTVSAYCTHVADPGHVCLSVDGAACGGDVVRQMASEFNVSVRVSPENKGKLIVAILASFGERYLSTPLFNQS